MNFVACFMAVFSILGALDRILGNRFGIGKEFEKGFMLFGNMALSMIGMIILSPLLAQLLQPVSNALYHALRIDPSIIPASLFANDMGGAPLSVQMARDESLGYYNALVVSSMMGCTISFTIPYALGIVAPEKHKDVLLGFLCGIVTIPIGCLVSGLVLQIPIGKLLWNLLPLVLFSAAVACGLLFCPMLCVKIFGIFGTIIKIMITVGLALGIVRFLIGWEIVPGLETLEEGAAVCLNASVVMTGAFPFLHILSRLLSKPLQWLAAKMQVNPTSAMGFLSSIATSMTTFEMVKDMDRKGVVLNSAFAISAAFTFAGHLAFTLSFQADYIFPVILGKLTAGLFALLLALGIYARIYKQPTENEVQLPC